MKVRSLQTKPEVPGERGIPKRAVDFIVVSPQGVEGDYNRYRHERKRDDPAHALLVVTYETLQTLKNEGWPVSAGDLGENVTSEGVAYDAFVIGQRVAIGNVLVQISEPCVPCSNLAVLPYVGATRVKELIKRFAIDEDGTRESCEVARSVWAIKSHCEEAACLQILFCKGITVAKMVWCLVLVSLVTVGAGCTATVGVPNLALPSDARAQCESQCGAIGMSLGAVAIMAGRLGCICDASGASPRAGAATAAAMAAIQSDESQAAAASQAANSPRTR